MPVAITISPARPHELAFVEHLRRSDSQALGFLSTAALRQKIDRGFVWLVRLAGRPCGFVMHGSTRGREVRIFQLAIAPPLRGRGLAQRLVATLIDRCRRAGACGLSLRCREALAANRFWHATGFTLHDLESSRSGHLFVWVRKIVRGPVGEFSFHSRWHPCPACGRSTCDTWTNRGVRRRTCVACTTIGSRAV